MNCPICHEEKKMLPRIIYDKTRICRDCYNSAAIRVCISCLEAFPIKHILLTPKNSPICTGCYDARQAR